MTLTIDIAEKDFQDLVDEMRVRKLWVEMGCDSPMASDRILAQIARKILKDQKDKNGSQVLSNDT